MALYGTASNPIIEARINGAWTDITARVRGEQKAVITRGRANEQARTAAQSCALTLENQDGYFSTRDPASTNFGLIPKNTQLRASAGAGDVFLRLPFNDSGDLRSVSTADKAVLDIVGDIDVRMEFWPHTWRPAGDMILMSKYQITSEQRSWALFIDSAGKLCLTWTTAGTVATRTIIRSTVALPASSTVLAVKATLDVNNGAAGNTVAFYTASSIAGVYTQLGASVITAGVTSVFSSSADLVVGGGDDTAGIFSGGLGVGGRIYKAEVYTGISGARVANMDATTRTYATTTWSDGLATPNTWTISGGRISSDRLRFWGELSSLPKKWDKSGTDVTIPATASGMIRRLTQGATPVRSAIYRNFTQYSPYAYWTFEDGSDATRAASAASNGRPGIPTNVTFASAVDLPGAERTLAFRAASSQMVGNLTSTPTNTGTVSLVFYVKLSALPATTKVFLSLTTGGTARRIEIGISNAAWNVEFFNTFGTSLGSSSTAIGSISPLNQWIGYNLLLQTSGTAMTYSVRWDVVGGTFGGGIGPTSIASCTVRPINSFKLYAANDTSFNDAQFGHLFMSTQNLDLTTQNFRDASKAYLGERSATRMNRLAGEEGVPLEISGYFADTETMGYQTASAFMDLMYECADADGGIIGETRDALSLSYRTRVDLERRADVALNYHSSHLSEVPEPTDDDQGVVNDVTVSRTNASSARAVVTDGATSVSDPPSGIGRYDTALTLNVGSDDRLLSIAGWIALVGSWDQDRYPNLAVALHRTPITASSSLTAQIIALDLGDTAILSGLPAWMTPNDIPELVQGYTETLGKHTWDVDYNATPAGPYRSVPDLGDATFVPRLDATTHTITSSLTTTATAVSLTTPSGSAKWVTSTAFPSDFPFDVVVAGERMTVTALTGAASPQTATVTRSVNGIVKTHSAGELIRLADPYYVGR